MEFQQLEMFVAVVETGSVSRAAERVFRTAPAVSIALRKCTQADRLLNSLLGEKFKDRC